MGLAQGRTSLLLYLLYRRASRCSLLTIDLTYFTTAVLSLQARQSMLPTDYRPYLLHYCSACLLYRRASRCSLLTIDLTYFTTAVLTLQARQSMLPTDYRPYLLHNCSTYSTGAPVDARQRGRFGGAV
eukprot:scaffold14896_cov55-Phaeocystis_antarctica.AAC.2